MTNNAAERALRAIAVGRRNWTFAGSDAGGRRAAAMYTLIETAKLCDVDPQAWLADLLARLQDHRTIPPDASPTAPLSNAEKRKKPPPGGNGFLIGCGGPQPPRPTFVGRPDLVDEGRLPAWRDLFSTTIRREGGNISWVARSL